MSWVIRFVVVGAWRVVSGSDGLNVNGSWMTLFIDVPSYFVDVLSVVVTGVACDCACLRVEVVALNRCDRQAASVAVSFPREFVVAVHLC